MSNKQFGMTTLSLARDLKQNNQTRLHRLTVNRIARGIDQARGHEDQQVALAAHRRLAAEEAAGNRDVAEEWNLVVDLLHVFADQPAKNDSLAIPDHNAGDHIAGGKQWLLDVVGNRNDIVTRRQGNRRTVVDKSQEIRDLRNERQADRIT